MVREPTGDRDAASGGFAGSTDLRRRELRDAAGRTWSAREYPIPRAEWTIADEQSDLAGYGVGWLYFVSGDEVRRLRLYPKHWHRLSDAELEPLCRRALRAPDTARRTG